MIAHIPRAVRLLPLTAFVAVSGCFATRNDVRVVQADLASFRTEQLKSNAEQREALAQAIRTLGVASDSVRVMSNRLTSVQGDIKGGLRAVNDQLIQVQELLKQSDATIRRLRAEQEERLRAPTVTVPTTPPLTAADSVAAAAAAAAAPQDAGPSSLYASGMSQFNRGSYATARSIFQDVLTRYPTSDNAPGAQLGIGRAFEAEKNNDAAMAAYGAVVQKFPDSPQAATALYKHARLLIAGGKPGEAKPLLTQITTKFKSADEYELAVDLLKTLR